MLLRRVHPPDQGRPGALCRYHREGGWDGRLDLDGVVLVGPTRLQRLHARYEERSSGFTDCATLVEQPVYVVADRDSAGRRRVVTVDLGQCGEILAEVHGRSDGGLATSAHVRLLTATWAGR